MTTTQNMRNATSGTESTMALHLLLTEGEVKITAEMPEKVMEEIHARAEQVGSVLENILLEPHGHPRWGLND